MDQGVLKVPKGYLDEKEKEAMKGTLWEAFMYLYGMKDEGSSGENYLRCL